MNRLSRNLRSPRIHVFFLSLILPIASVATGAAGEKNLELSVSTPSSFVRLGSTSSISINISGEAIEEMFAETPGIKVSFAPASFNKRLQFAPREPGIYSIGPYELEVNGQLLKSNVIEIEVLPKLTEPTGIRLWIHHPKIQMGEAAELIFEMWGESIDYSTKVQLNQDLEGFEIENGQTSTSTSFSDGVQYRYSMKSWKLLPKDPGTFQITSDDFSDIPDGLEIEPMEIIVSE